MPLIKNFNWYGINNPTSINNFRKFERNNLAIALVVFYVNEDVKEFENKENGEYSKINRTTKPPYLPKQYFEREKKLFSLIISEDI